MQSKIKQLNYIYYFLGRDFIGFAHRKRISHFEHVSSFSVEILN